MLKRLLLIAAFAWLALIPFAMAVELPLPDPNEEAHAYALFHQIKCRMCQKDSLADSPADEASVLRDAIRRRVAAGDNDEEVKDYLVAHYGDAVQVRPDYHSVEAAKVYLGPFLLLIVVLALGALLIHFVLKIDFSKK